MSSGTLPQTTACKHRLSLHPEMQVYLYHAKKKHIIKVYKVKRHYPEVKMLLEIKDTLWAKEERKHLDSYQYKDSVMSGWG